jgi:sulfatase maturation enzyme AslB (radical SAM superfamily)
VLVETHKKNKYFFDRKKKKTILCHPLLYFLNLSFAITTNGLLMEKYMNFLVENDFNLLISLDGNAKNNRYRVFKNGKPAFKKILENIRALQANSSFKL